MIFEPIPATVGALCFALHVYGRYKNDPVPEKFIPYMRHNMAYLLTSIAFCALGILLKDEIAEPLGFSKPLTYVAVVCYGAGHMVSRVLGMQEAAKLRKSA